MSVSGVKSMIWYRVLALTLVARLDSSAASAEMEHGGRDHDLHMIEWDFCSKDGRLHSCMNIIMSILG